MRQWDLEFLRVLRAGCTTALLSKSKLLRNLSKHDVSKQNVTTLEVSLNLNIKSTFFYWNLWYPWDPWEPIAIWSSISHWGGPPIQDRSLLRGPKDSEISAIFPLNAEHLWQICRISWGVRVMNAALFNSLSASQFRNAVGVSINSSVMMI